MTTISSQQLLSQMRIMAAQAQSQPPQLERAGNSFAKTLSNVVENVNASQKTAAQMQTALQASLQISNKCIEAYQSIMNMPI